VTAPLPFLDDLRAAAAEPAGPAWLAARRAAAAAAYERLGLPTPKNEDWHYTSVAPIAEGSWTTFRSASSDLTAADLEPFTFGQGATWPTLVFVNGRFARELSTPAERLPDGLRVAVLSELVAGAAVDRDVAELAERWLGTVADAETQPFTALNAALMTDGALLHVGKEMVVEHPVHLLFVNDALAAKSATHPRNLVVADRHSKLTVLESHVAIGDASYLTNAVTEIVLGDGATVSHYKVQRESARAYHVGTVDTRQGRDSHFLNFSFATGAALSRTNVYTVLGGEGCGTTLNGLYMLDGAQHCDHQTRVEHVEPNCFSRELYKGLLDGTSHGVFNGKVYVHPEAQKTDGKQENHSLLLSRTAQVDTKPQLEIFADDVKCTHGATVGQLDQTALFYMKSRGIAPALARQLLTYAFAADVLETIELDAVREGLEAYTLERFTKQEATVG
jgi:Fe-S cluster assembly protein SufD